MYVNEEYPMHMKRNRDILQPILKLAKTLPAYKDKSHLQGDELVIDGTHYTVKDLSHLPPDLAPYKAAQHTDNHTLVFHGELFPYSNFLKAPFTHDNQHFPTSEHFIQYQKAMFFGDTYAANAILHSDTPYEAKRLFYQINGANSAECKESAYDICFAGIKQKFIQNPTLLNMLCATKPLTIAEASTDKTWGTGISIRDQNALSKSHWHSAGWMSQILHDIRDEL